MRIEELTPGLNIELVANIGGEQLIFDSRIENVYPRKHLVLAAPVLQDNRVISFRAKGLIVDVLVTLEDDKPQLFKNVTVTVMKKPDGTFCYNLATAAMSKTYNRRHNFRCYVGAATSVQFGSNHRSHEAVIKDISANGFSFVCGNDITFGKDQLVHTVLNDYLEELAENFSFHLYGIIVRSYPLDDMRTVYGCRLNKKVTGLDAYIMKKERLRLKRLSGTINFY